MIRVIFLSIISTMLFMFLKELVLKYDKEHGIIQKKYGNIMMAFLSIINSVIIYYFDKKLLTQLILVLSFSVLLTCVYTDFKTNFVYRIYSYSILTINFIYLLINKNSFLDAESLTLIVFVFVINILGKKNCFGKGDSYILIANSFLIILLNQNKYLPVEVILWHFIIAVVLMILFNLKQMDFKTLKFKKPIPFVPYIYIATIIIIILYIKK